MPQYKLQASGQYADAYHQWLIDADDIAGAMRIYRAKERIMDHHAPTFWAICGELCPECQTFIDAHDSRQYCEACSGRARQ